MVQNIFFSFYKPYFFYLSKIWNYLRFDDLYRIELMTVVWIIMMSKRIFFMIFHNSPFVVFCIEIFYIFSDLHAFFFLMLILIQYVYHNMQI